MRIGIFGGTFDPPHLGHLILAEEAVDQLKLDRLLWVLTPNPPHKQGQIISPVSDRLPLLKAAVEGHPKFEISLIELERPGPHYSLDTVRILKQQYPGNEWIFLVGEDSLRDLPVWHMPRELVEEVTALGVMRRPGITLDPRTLEEQVPGISSKIIYYHTPLIEISSTEIRRRIADGRPYQYFLMPAVFRLISEGRLYK